MHCIIVLRYQTVYNHFKYGNISYAAHVKEDRIYVSNLEQFLPFKSRYFEEQYTGIIVTMRQDFCMHGIPLIFIQEYRFFIRMLFEFWIKNAQFKHYNSYHIYTMHVEMLRIFI